MAIIELRFQGNITPSLQVGDTVYYCVPQQSNKGNITTNKFSDITKLGSCSAIDIAGKSIRVENVPSNIDAPLAGSFIFFSKDNKVNLSSVKGYHATVTFRNNSTEKSKMFSIGLEAVESSK